MSNLFPVQHPLVEHHLAQLRDVATDPAEWRSHSPYSAARPSAAAAASGYENAGMCATARSVVGEPLAARIAARILTRAEIGRGERVTL